MIHSENSKKNKNHFVGCLLGGAIGDAFGWPIEFMKLDSIKNKYGENGLAKLFIGSNGKAEITDDTQMTMFTAEGLLRANNRLNSKGICHAPTVIYFAYLRWLYTQGYPKKENYDFIYDGWLIEIKELFFRRAPGNSCISSLLSDKKGNINFKINDSKGCGAIMRSAPFGLFLRSEEALEISRESAALTHGHPTGQIAAGGLSYC
jgi:ADP-ribosylglycohydrolase